MSDIQNQVEAFIRKLANTDVPKDVFNQYSHSLSENSVRRNNFFLYLKQIAGWEARMMLVGEAPGYRGCRLAGVPFTSEFILLGGIPGLDLFGEPQGYKKTREFDRVWRGPSSTILWKTLKNLDVIPLLWNALPFHPHGSGNSLSNRTPNSEELKIGESFIRDLIRIFGIDRVVAVGNKAESTLIEMNVPCEKVRHPSHGGKKDFVRGVKRILSGNKGAPLSTL